jgi:hypothetical protein
VVAASVVAESVARWSEPCFEFFNLKTKGARMIYAVLIEKEDGTKDFKAFANSADAIKRRDTAQQYILFREPAKINGEEIYLVSCHAFKVETDDVREAQRLVLSGEAQRLEPLDTRIERIPSLDEI